MSSFSRRFLRASSSDSARRRSPCAVTVRSYSDPKRWRRAADRRLLQAPHANAQTTIRAAMAMITQIHAAIEGLLYGIAGRRTVRFRLPGPAYPTTPVENSICGVLTQCPRTIAARLLASPECDRSALRTLGGSVDDALGVHGR